MKKVILISIDGMRPDGLKLCGNPYVSTLEEKCAYTYDASSLVPSITFPCHYGMMRSSSPEKLGVTGGVWSQPKQNVKGIFEKVLENGGKPAMVYGWRPLLDIAGPSYRYAIFIDLREGESIDTRLTDEALHLVEADKPDFVFLYLVDTDEKGGHACGWMTDEYLRRISIAIDNVKRVFEALGDEYSIVIMSDHGGHGRGHGTTMPEDMNIPLFFYGSEFKPGEITEKLSLLDIVPTIAKIMDIPPEDDWEGHSII